MSIFSKDSFQKLWENAVTKPLSQRQLRHERSVIHRELYELEFFDLDDTFACDTTDTLSNQALARYTQLSERDRIISPSLGLPTFSELLLESANRNSAPIASHNL